MKVKTYSRINEIEGLWRALYSNNKEFSWFQSYEWNDILEKQYYARKYTRYYGCKLEYLVIDEYFVAPLIIDEFHKKVELLGDRESSDYLTFIFDTKIKNNDLKLCIEYLINRFKKFLIILDRIHEETRLANLLIEIKSTGKAKIHYKMKECVWINTNIQSQSYYNTLSKSARQNYRTAINRIRKDGLEYNVVFEIRKCGLKESNVFLDIYEERRKICDIGNSFKDKIKFFVHMFIKKLLFESDIDILTNYSRSTEVFLSVIKINGKIGAFCEGNINNNCKIISIARVSTKKEFYQYSPGYILLIETIEGMKDSLDYFDLTRGTEDYKFKLGGVIHFNYCFEIK